MWDWDFTFGIWCYLWVGVVGTELNEGVILDTLLKSENCLLLWGSSPTSTCLLEWGPRTLSTTICLVLIGCWTFVTLPPFCYWESGCSEHSYECLFEFLFSVFSSIYLRVELLDLMANPRFTFWGTITLFSTVAVLFYIPSDDILGF